MVSELTDSDSTPDSKLGLGVLDSNSEATNDDYVQLQLRIYRLTLCLTAFFVVISAVFVDLRASISLLIGALSGVLYLRLLAKGIGKLGKSANAVSKIQLVVPVLLIVTVSKITVLQLLPAILGFLLYKPSLIIQFLLESSRQERN